jgi:hypothetical protein
MPKLQGKVALVFGGSSGIGLLVTDPVCVRMAALLHKQPFHNRSFRESHMSLLRVLC